MYRDGEISGSAGVGHNIEIVRLRIRRAKALGISYRELTSIILDTGRYPTGGTDDAE